MRDEALVGIDEALARAAERPRHVARIASARRQTPTAAHDDARVRTRGPIASVLDSEVLPHLFFAIQFLWAIPLFLPNAQGVRFVVRALPYVSSLGFLLLYLSRPQRRIAPEGTAMLISAMFLLVLNLLHPTSQPYAGMAQCIFQLAIASPMFWMHKAVRSPRQLERLVATILVLNFLSAGLGVLQVYYPDRFLPPQFNTMMSTDMLDALSYVGAEGRMIVRPPGLSDQPGSAALAGGITAIIGLGLALTTRKRWHILAVSLMSGVGLAAVYLTQVRSILLMTLGAAALVGLIVLRQGRLARAGVGLALGTALVMGSFAWATSVGGASVQDRFVNIREEGAVAMYQSNRGLFLSHTVGELLDQYPLGAGVGRWGMMQQYFGGAATRDSAPIYVEIQPTGWLLDGGLPMWFLYGGAILLSMMSVLKLAMARDEHIQRLGPVIFAIQLFVAGMSFAGPAFNMQLGILFWSAGAALVGAAYGPRDGSPATQAQ